MYEKSTAFMYGPNKTINKYWTKRQKHNLYSP